MNGEVSFLRRQVKSLQLERNMMLLLTIIFMAVGFFSLWSKGAEKTLYNKTIQNHIVEMVKNCSGTVSGSIAIKSDSVSETTLTCSDISAKEVEKIMTPLSIKEAKNQEEIKDVEQLVALTRMHNRLKELNSNKETELEKLEGRE